ncbi:MAG: hypothetical protein Q8Q56_05105, partial [Alphaproteobacteria bacterium]|nr:hypothetical protein [Alphaproteobacteria bacterium]
MKTIITIALLTSTSLLTDNYAAALDDGTLSACGGAGRTTASVTPSTLGDLEIFLRTKCGTVFPEIGFSEFSTPFKPGFAKLKRISQMRAQTAAINTIGQMVALGYYSFTREIESLKVRTPHFTDRIVSRSEAMTHYHRHNHSYFLTFQAMIMQVLEWAQTRTGDLANDAKAALTQSHGSSTALKIAWLQDNTGIVPVPFQGALTRTIYSSATPYGNWGDDYQRSMVFVDGQLIAAPGIHIETKDGITFKFIRENGLRNGFITSPLTMRASPDHPLVSTLLGMGAFRIGASRSDGLDALLALPETALENKEFEAAFLEELM